ncbi:MAG: hypothetical protein KC620_04325 [Myxococcales bacterium]|nr:hypothetical protein [Myxococcales bacterium]
MDPTIEDWLSRAEQELAGADESWRGGNAGRGRVGSRRAAGMAIVAWLTAEPQEGYGRNFMHHLNALADDERFAAGVREAAWRLAARPAPGVGWRVEPPRPLTPMADAQLIGDFCRKRLAALVTP